MFAFTKKVAKISTEQITRDCLYLLQGVRFKIALFSYKICTHDRRFFCDQKIRRRFFNIYIWISTIWFLVLCDPQANLRWFTVVVVDSSIP